MKVLITGGGGSIGRNLAERLRQHGGYEVFAPPRRELDLLDAGAVEGYLVPHRFDAVIHGAVEGVGRDARPHMLEHNCRMFFNLARHSQAFGRMLFLSSGAVYDQTHWHGAMPESYFGTHVPADDYGFSKYICARAADAFERIYEMRVFGVFGPHEDWRVRFVSNTCCRALFGMPVVIRRNIRFDYLDVDDLGRILECCLAVGLRHRHYNVCRGTTFELPDLASRIAAIAGRPLDITVADSGPVKEYGGDNSRLLAELPGMRFHPIDESLSRLYRWYEERRDAIDPGLLE